MKAIYVIKIVVCLGVIFWDFTVCYGQYVVVEGEIEHEYYRLDPGVEELMDGYDVTFYWLDLEVSNLSNYLSGNVLIEARVKEDLLDTIVFQLTSVKTIDSIFLNHQKHPFVHENHLLTLIPDDPLAANSSFTVRVFYEGGTSGLFYTGVHNKRSGAWGNRVTWTFSQPFYAYKWFPCKQTGRDKADSAYIYLTVNASLKAVSNGVLTEITDLENGNLRYEWKTWHPVMYDMIVFAVSDYLEYDYPVYLEGIDDSLDVDHFIYSSEYLEAYQLKLDSIELLVQYFSSLFGPYPYWPEKYGYAIVPGVPCTVEQNTLVTMPESLDFFA